MFNSNGVESYKVQTLHGITRGRAHRLSAHGSALIFFLRACKYSLLFNDSGYIVKVTSAQITKLRLSSASLEVVVRETNLRLRMMDVVQRFAMSLSPA
jgi:hypothetical protein